MLHCYCFSFHHRFKINEGVHLTTDVYRFVSRYNRIYLVEVEVYEKSFYFLKFYLRSHNRLPGRYKYRVLIGDNDSFRIFNTCIAIASEILKKDPLASFGFIGVDSDDEKSIANTKRYRIYKKLAVTYFSTENFDHQKDDSNSMYLLLNRGNQELNKDEINQKINEIYII